MKHSKLLHLFISEIPTIPLIDCYVITPIMRKDDD
jgi:hypothetical protein